MGHSLGKHTCPNCGKQYTYKSGLSQHMKYECGKEAMFQCPHCPHRSKQKARRLFATSAVADSAATPISGRTGNTRRGEPGRFSCDNCKKTYRYYSGLWSHKKYECGKDPQFVCPHCPYKAKLKRNLKTHVACILTSSDFFFTPTLSRVGRSVDEFDQVFCLNLKGLRRNSSAMSAESATGAGHVCSKCGKSYRYHSGLWQHQKYECGKEPQFACTYCPYKSKLKTLPPSEYACNSCGKTYKHSGSLSKHKKYECGLEPQFSCSFCPYRSKQKAPIKSHIINKHYEEYRASLKIQICDNQNQNLTSRLGPVVRLRPKERLYECPDCPKAYRHRQSLHNHKKFECRDKPRFFCPLCSFHAKYHIHLKRHMATAHALAAGPPRTTH
ncbi:zinc finger protein 333-like [Cimex lectularius]|uniref:C2H2-type domain-containing protein n=1 Tax=Cimex lectularius TaxID=79782 RepID=A0A8I6RQC2_CIMLE|nr:zinc finger protein 333-like [Cimex lectularius]